MDSLRSGCDLGISMQIVHNAFIDLLEHCTDVGEVVYVGRATGSVIVSQAERPFVIVSQEV